MTETRLASGLAERWRLQIAAIGALSAAMSAANMLSLLPDNVAYAAAALIAVPGLGLFACAIFDQRFHNALSALNASRRQLARTRGWAARLFGLGLPAGDRLLFAVALILLPVVLVAGNAFHQLSAAALAVAGFWLVTIARIALMVRGQPDDQFIAYF